MPRRPAQPSNPLLNMHALRAYRASEHPDIRVAAVAAQQYGVISTGQARACGLSRGAIAHRLRTGRFVPQYHGVYAVGHGALRPEGHRMAAVLACGPYAGLSHRAAGRPWSVWSGSSGVLDVTRPPGLGPGPSGIRLHVGPLEPHDVTILDGIPITSLERTVVDIAADLHRPHAIRRLVDDAMRHPAFDLDALQVQLVRGRPGTAAVRAELRTRHPQSHHTRSEFEAIALPLLAAHRVLRPEVNVWLPDLNNEVDLLWRAERVVVEWDSRMHHDDVEAFERDREQSVELLAAGYVPLRFTWRQLHDRPSWLVQHVQQALARSGAA